MERFIENYDGTEFDLVIVGGGITGAAVAHDAASRGLAVAVLEKQDFGCATSAATSKLIHGGFRYLANAEFGLVRESLRERRTLENIAPNYVYPLPGLFTAYNRKLSNNLTALSVAMTIYDLLSFDKGKTWDQGKRIPPHKTLSADEAIALEPNIKPQGLQGAGMQYDCQSLCPERLTLAFLRTAIKNGARAANYAKVEEFIISDDKRVSGVRVKDLLNDRTALVRGKLTMNCAGPWADLVLGMLHGCTNEKKLRRSEGIHIITRKLVEKYMVAGMGKSGGHFFVIPWRGHSLLGTTDKEYIGDPDEYKVSREAIEGLLEEVNSGFGREPLEYKDVLHAYGGLRPLVEDQTKGSYESSRKYEIYDNGKDGFDGLITVEGGKYTTSRNLAEAAMTMVAAKLGRDLGKCTTAEKRLAGCEIDNLEKFIAETRDANKDFDPATMEWLARQYGTDHQRILDLARGDAALAEKLDADGEIAAQAVYAVREEMARTLQDVLMRRTGIGTLGNPGQEIIAKVADLMARELGWDDARRQREIDQVTAALTLP